MTLLQAIHAALWAGAIGLVAVGLWRRRHEPGPELDRLALAAAILVIAGDVVLTIAIGGLGIEAQALRLIPPLLCLPLVAHARGWRWREIGFRLPEQPLRTWIAITAALGGAGVALVAIGLAILWISGWAMPVRVPPFEPFMLSAIVIAPVQEELIYRFALCTPAEPVLGKWTTITLSGLVFAGIHYVYGNPGPDNFVGGFILAWAYLESRSLLVPIILHALGNLFVYVALVVLARAI